ncbi:aldehyde dehydrogenase [Acrocarpospora phusangensis]|uniref:Aldehyde dehydrogenase n=1 Tax=Acrocarpospora phusangensis TaxID=1070424 RepID=A0A919Q4V5_9ACTN|nr:aldehyde dehydrogenase family protein [Acrocarpospora phusangensis]GIH22181.1 aldehyde dehydrogenase [Acrocarpospora phusangensis]
MAERSEVFIGGRWVTGTGSRLIEVRNPATGARVGRAGLASLADVDDAVAAARAGFDSGVWAEAAPGQRAQVLRTAADLLEKRAGEIARLITAELGSPIGLSERLHVPDAIRHLRCSADVAESFPYDERRADGGDTSLVTRRPVGVVAAITPWHGPLSMPALKVAPALAAGCSVVLKPPPETPLSAYQLAEALVEAGLPPDVLSVLPGDRDAGAHLVEHPRVDMVDFTGSGAAGRTVVSACVNRAARVTMEFGGRAAAVVLDDADLDAVVPALLPVALAENGQAGIAQTRLLVPRAKADALVEALAEGLRAQRVGDPMDPATTIGPMVGMRQRDRVLGYVESGREAGARVVTGTPPSTLPGWFVTPTLLAGVESGMRVARAEVFGPVLAVTAYEGEDQAVAYANEEPFARAASVWSADAERALAVARRIRTGTVSVNGRRQASGGCVEAFRTCLESKSIAL